MIFPEILRIDDELQLFRRQTMNIKPDWEGNIVCPCRFLDNHHSLKASSTHYMLVAAGGADPSARVAQPTHCGYQDVGKQ